MSEVIQGLPPASVPLDERPREDAWVPSIADLAISESGYRWTNRVFQLLERLLSVKLRLHGGQHMQRGEIFLFNHFARFETFIPQYFIYQQCGAFSRSIASSEFFQPDDAFSRYLMGVGAVPNSLPDLLPFLAIEALKGRKVIVFPEGGMVKDRRVVDDNGRYSVYSRTAQVRRKHHSGAAVLALALDAFKRSVLEARRRHDLARLNRLAESVEMSTDALIEAARRPTSIVPSNITFYPIRVGENLLSKGAELIGRGVSRRLSEELMIEGNILLKDTDMDIRLGTPVQVSKYWRWWERPLIRRASSRFDSMRDAFNTQTSRGPLGQRLLARAMRRDVQRVRDDYMHRMYTSVSVNLSHLASVLILSGVELGYEEVEIRRMRRMLYRAVREVQKLSGVHLHDSLRSVSAYADLPWRGVAGFEQFIETVVRTGLMETRDGHLRFLPKLKEDHGFDEVRLENLVEVYANEVQPLPQVGKAVREVIVTEPLAQDATIAALQVADELKAFAQDRAQFEAEEHRAINELETASASSAPFLLPGAPNAPVGVVLLHGFLASPAEMRGLGEFLHGFDASAAPVSNAASPPTAATTESEIVSGDARGVPVYGVRLKGHGTSPWDLRERSYEDWVASTLRGIAIMQGLCERVVLVGFSTGGTLALHAAAQAPEQVAAVCAVCSPVRFKNPHMRFVPIVHGANRLVRSLSALDGVKPFTSNDPENPEINYRHMPMRGLYELRQLVDATLPTLDQVVCPVTLMQASDDPVVVPNSMKLLSKALTNAPVEQITIESKTHGIVYSNIGDTWQRVAQFVSNNRER